MAIDTYDPATATQHLVTIHSIKATYDGTTLNINLTFHDDNAGVDITGDYGYRDDDPFGQLVPQIKQWLVNHEGEYEVIPYVEKVLTAEEKRAQMPALTSRQFWMAAANIDIDKDVIVAAIKSEMPDSIDRKMMIAELEASTFERLNPTITDVMELLEIPADQVDDLWVWAAGL